MSTSSEYALPPSAPLDWGRVRAGIFDMDDLLVGTADLWRSAESRLFGELGRDWNADLARTYKGMNALDVAATICTALAGGYRRLSVEQCQRIMRDVLIDAFAKSPPAALPGAVETVRYFSARGRRLSLAVASGSPKSVIEQVMRRLGIFDCFGAIVSSESVPRGKPHPDVFLAAARALEVDPIHCLVYEDSLIGVRAARSANMQVIWVPSSPPADASIRALASAVYDRIDASIEPLERWERCPRMTEADLEPRPSAPAAAAQDPRR